MSVPREVLNTIEQTERIHSALVSEGLPSEIVRNPQGEALAVVARRLFDPSEVTSTPATEELWADRASQHDTIDRLRNILPISGPKMYPARFLDAVDLVAQTAVGNTGVSATEFKSKIQDDSDFMRRGQGLGLHADFVGAYRDKDLPLDGLNIHATRWGRAMARFGILRTLDESELRAAKYADEPTGTRKQQDEAYGRLAAPFTDPVELHPGDVLVFQAQQRPEKGIAGVAHDFATTSDTRRSDVFTPYVGDSVTVSAQRAALIEELAHKTQS